MIIIHHSKKPGQAFLAQFSFPWFAILVFNYFWLPSISAAISCVETQIPKDECKALVALYNSTNGPNWSDRATNNWNVTNTPCSWTGVTCDSTSSPPHHVTRLDRGSKNLSGSIPENLNNLTQLQQLNLGVNQLTGTIPPNLNSLTQLNSLVLSYNQLTGPIPNLSALTQLTDLHLGINQLTTNASLDWIGHLKNLQSLTLSGLSGSIPDWISNLTQLTFLALDYGQLTGSIPSWINTLTHLQELNLSVNQLTGSIPNLSPLKQLKRLNLSYNQLSGSILDLSTLTQLNWLFINDNQLCGDIPPSLTTLNELSKLNIENNHLTTSDPTLIDFLNTNNPSWINQTPCPTIPSLQTLPPTMNLTINFSGNGQGRVTTEPSGIDCDSSQSKCSHSYETADWIKLIPTAAAGSEFTGWSGYQSDCDDGELFMSGSRSCTVYFERLHFPLTVSQVGQGKVNSTPTGIECGTRCRYQFEINTPITLTTTPAANWQFEKWQGDCDANGVVIMDKEKQCQAVFVTVSPDTTSGVPPTPPSNTNSNTQPVVTTAQGINQTPVKDNNYPVTVPQPNLVEPEIIAPAIPADVLKSDLETDNHEVIPQWVVNPGSHDFGKIPVGNVSPAQVITVTNVGGQVDLQLGELTVSSDEFILAEACSNQTLSVGNHCTATVSFQPQLLAGVKTAYLTIPIANPNQTTVTVVTLTGNAIKDQSLFTGYPLGHDPIDSPLLVTFISPLAAVITPEGVKLDWEITATDNNQIAEIHLWRAESVKGNCPADIHQYVQKTAMELANKPHLDYQGTDTACYGLQVIEYNGKVTWYITSAR